MHRKGAKTKNKSVETLTQIHNPNIRMAINNNWSFSSPFIHFLHTMIKKSINEERPINPK